MAEARLQAELAETKAEIQRLRERFSIGTPTVHKDLSLISLVPKWSGSETAVPLEEFFSSIEGSALVGNWEDSDKCQVAILKLTDAAKEFYNGCTELHLAFVTWQKFKSAFRHRFRDVHTDQYHFTKLQTARQGRNETPQEFADRCRALSQKIICKVNDPLAQSIHYENAERMLLASFVAGLTGVPGRQVRYANPQTMEQALKIALSVQEAEKQEKFNESFYTRFDNSVRIQSHTSRRARPEDYQLRRLADSTRAASHMPGQHHQTPRSTSKATTPDNRNAQTKAALRCYECEGVGHFARECPTRLNREVNSSNSPGRRNPSERSRRSRSPSDKPQHEIRMGVRKENNESGKGERQLLPS
jgi:hypothetical protein